MQKYSSVAIDAFGNVLPGAIVSVYNAGTAVLASVFSDNGVTPLLNPFVTGSNGAYKFYAANGRYDIVLAKTGYTFVALDTSDMLLYDPTGVTGTQFGGHLFGLTLSNNGSDATNDLDIAVGEAVSDDVVLANRVLMSLATAVTKQIDATWAAGTNAGMRDSSDTLAGAKWFHVFEFVRGTGDIDIFASTSITPSLPDGGTNKRRIGSIYWDGAKISPFSQNGDEFLWKTVVLDVDHANPGTSRVTKVLLVPTSVVVDAKVRAYFTSNSTPAHLVMSPVLETDAAPSSTAVPLLTLTSGTNFNTSLESEIRTNTSAQIVYRASASDGNTVIRIATRGWVDSRGRLY